MTARAFIWTPARDTILRLAVEQGETFEAIARRLRTGHENVARRFGFLGLERPGIRDVSEIHPRWYDSAFFARVRREAGL